MSGELLDVIPLWGLSLIAAVLAILALEAGYQLGKWRHERASDER